VAKVDPKQTKEQEKEVPVQINRDIDILFVVDNSGSMREEQESLAANFNRFINVLENIEGGLPNVHLGVVSTDLGAGPYGIMGCTGQGDNGILQNSPSSACSGPDDAFIKDIALESGDRDRNYTGTLADTFSCIAQLGTNGCGFEQPLEAMRRALNGSNPQNNAFLRDDAFLAVIFITDEDDCSTENLEMFDSDPARDMIDSDLGFLSSFRCFEFGVACEPDTPRAVGPRQNCIPRDGTTPHPGGQNYMYGIQEYVDFLKSLKPDPSMVIVAGIIGNPTPVNVETDDEEPVLAPSCISGSGEADPGVRMNDFLASFPQRSTTTTICNEDLSDALTVIAELLRKVIGNPCLEGNLHDSDPNVDGVQPECTVSDVTNLGRDGQTEKILDTCNAEKSNIPCYYFELNPDQCTGDDQPTKLTLVVERGEGSVAPNTTVVARCVAD
jgi:hypothetical protein